MIRHSGKFWAFLSLGKLVSWHPQNGRLPLTGGAGFPLFNGSVRALLQEDLVVSAGPLCSTGREASWHQQNSKVWSLGFTCIYGSGLLALCGKLRMPMGQQSQQA
jgi:hypothetical protein